MRVLFVTRKWPPAVGGMETYSRELSRELEKRSDIDLTCKILKGRKDGRPPHAVSVALFFFRTAIYLARNSQRFDVIHFGDLVQIGLAWISRMRSPRTKTLIALHGLDVVYGRRDGVLPKIYAKYLNWGNRRDCVDCFFANSRNTGRLLADQGFAPITVVPLGVRLREIGRSEPVQDIDAEQRFVLFFGRIFRRKGPKWFAETVLPLLPDDVSFMVIGTIWHSAYGKDLQKLPRVTMPGAFPNDISRDEFENLKRRAIAIVMPNVKNPEEKDVEGFGLTALEAADGGAPLIAARLEGIQDAVIDGTTGFLCPPEDASAWASKILELMSWDLSDRQSFAAKARQALLEYYSWERVAHDSVLAYRKCLDVNDQT